MQNQGGHLVESETETITSIQTSETDQWEHFRDDDIMQQQTAIQAEEAGKIPFISDKEPIFSLAVEYKSGSSILLEKIKILTEQYAAIRRTRGDGNCFFRSFMFAYLVFLLIFILETFHTIFVLVHINIEVAKFVLNSLKDYVIQNIQDHILESQDRAEVDRITANVEQCKKTLLSLDHVEFTFEDFFALFLEQLESVFSGSEASIRFITSGEIRKRSEFYEPFIQGLTDTSVEQFCKSSVKPMGEESDHVHIMAMSDALGVPIRIVYLDRSQGDKGSVSVNHHNFTLTNANAGSSEALKPFITLLYRLGHYDILYPK